MNDTSLVSVIIRTIGRQALLRRALEAVALQTYPRIEVVVVDAAGENDLQLSERCGPFPMRVVGTGEPLARSKAANVGLDHVRGEYVMFLDDDDRFEPGHIAALVEAMKEREDVLVVYSGVRCVDEEGQETGLVLNRPYDPVRLLAVNDIPIHALLFDRRLLGHGCRFDESLSVYEDWDFWLQLREHTDFQHLGQVSAEYRVSTGESSGVHSYEVARKGREAIIEKWRHRWNAEELYQLMEYAQEQAKVAAQERTIAAQERTIAAQERTIAAQERTIADQERTIAEQGVQLAARDAAIARRIAQIAERDRQLIQIYTSKEFRLVRLLRLPVRAMRYGWIFFKRCVRSPRHGLFLLTRAFVLWRQAGLWHLKRVAAFSAALAAKRNHEYDLWVRTYDTVTEEDRARMLERIRAMEEPPFISVVMPTYNVAERWLRRAVESVVAQIYPHWELCIADDASTMPHVRGVLEEYRSQDKRVKVVFRAKNGGVSAASNSALDLARGDFVALLDHDDEIPVHALYHVAEEICRNPSAMLVYSDEDKIDENGRRADPNFKPDWNPDLFLSQNYISHLGVYKTSLVKRLGGLRQGFEGSQDYDLALRAIEQCEPGQIRHIPRILYHWRMVSGSTAADIYAKPSAAEAARRAVTEHLDRSGVDAEVEGNDMIPGCQRVRYPVSEPPPLVSLIVPVCWGQLAAKLSLESISEKTSYPRFEIILAVHASETDAFEALQASIEAVKGIRILRPEGRCRYGSLINSAVEHADGELIGLLGGRLKVISHDWLTEMVSHALRPEIGVVGARLWRPDNTLEHAGLILGLGGIAGNWHRDLPRGGVGYFGRAALIQNFSAVSEACMLVRAQVLKDVGGLSEERLGAACCSLDFCLKIGQNGYRILWTPYADLRSHRSNHSGRSGRDDDLFAEGAEFIREHWGQILDRDPAYNPNLALDEEELFFAWPPRP